MHSDSLLIR
jgi:ribose transport system ATP-binding protein